MSDRIKSSGEFVRDFVPPDYLIDTVLQRRFCYAITAKTGVGKTAVAMRIAAHVATGRALCGLRVKKGQVLYLAGENPTDVQMRWLGLTREMGIEPNSVDVHFLPGVLQLSQVAQEVEQEIQRKQLQPVLVVVDTVMAYFEGDQANDNVQMGDHARMLRSLTLLPGGPCVLVLAHPTKSAAEDNLVPYGGGAFLNEIDGNIALQKRESLISASVQGKFRGPEFSPLCFELKVVSDHPVLKDSRGISLPTIIAQPLDAAARAALDVASDGDEDKMLRLIDDHPKAPMRALAGMLNWKNHSKVDRVIKNLITQKLIKREGRALILTQAGEKELNSQDKPVSTLVPSLAPPPPFPVPMRPQIP